MAAATPALTPAQSAGEQFGGVGGWALAPAAPPRNIAPANATAPTAPTTARCRGRPDGNIIAPSPSSSDWHIRRAVAPVERAPGRPNSGRPGGAPHWILTSR